MTDAVAADRKATAAEVAARASEIRTLARELGLVGLRLRGDGALVIHDNARGYRTANRLSAAASGVVGAYVHVITDDVPGAVSTRDL